MMIKTLICLSLFLIPLGSVAVDEYRIGGGVTIKDLSNPEYMEIARDAITEHNKGSSEFLIFERIVQGRLKMVSGVIYDLIIAAKNCSGVTKNYRANVYDIPWINYRCYHGGLKLWNP